MSVKVNSTLTDSKLPIKAPQFYMAVALPRYCTYTQSAINGFPMIGTNKHQNTILSTSKQAMLGARIGNRMVTIAAIKKQLIKKGLLPIMSYKNPLPSRAAKETKVA